MKIYFTIEFLVLILGVVIFFAAALYARKTNKMLLIKAAKVVILIVYLLFGFGIPDRVGDLLADNQGNTYIVAEERYFPMLFNHRVMKFNSAGRLEWAKDYRFIKSAVLGTKQVTVDEDNNLYISLVDPEENDSYLVKLYPEGKVAWKTPSPIEVEDLQVAGGKARILGVDDSGQLAVETFSLENGESVQVLPLPAKTGEHIFRNAACFDEEGNILFVGHPDAALAKFAPEGSKIWETAVNPDPLGWLLVSDRENHLYIGGRGFGLMQKCSPEGEVLWSTDIIAGSLDRFSNIEGISLDNDENAYVTGSWTDRNIAGESADRTRQRTRKEVTFLVKLAQSGEVVWEKTNVYLESSSQDKQKVFDADANGNCYIGNEESWQQGVSLTKFEPNGQRQWKAVTPGKGLMAIIAVLISLMLDLWPRLKAKKPKRAGVSNT